MLNYGLIFRIILTVSTAVIWIIGIKLSKFRGFVYLASKDIATLFIRLVILFEVVSGAELAKMMNVETTISAILNILAAFSFVNAWIVTSNRTWIGCIKRLFNI